MTIDEVEKAVAVTIHAKAIGERQCDLSIGSTAGLSRCDEGALRCGTIPELTLEGENFGVAHHREIEIVRFELG